MKENMMLQSSGMDIPDEAIERIARCLLPKMQADFEKEAMLNDDCPDLSAHEKTVPDKKQLVA